MIMCPVLGCGVRSADRKAARQHARLHADVQHGVDYVTWGGTIRRGRSQSSR